MSGIVGGAGSKSGIIGETELDYEEGTWTPNTNSAGNYTFSINSANYTKIGRMVMIQAYLAGNGDGDSTGLVIHGLPFVSTAGNHYSVGVVNFAVGNSSLNGKDCTARIGDNQSSIYFSYNAQVDIQQSDIDTGHFIFSVTYFAAS